MIAALMAAAVIHSVNAGDGPTPADCVGWWHQCVPGRDNNGTKRHGCFDVGGAMVATLPCTPPLPPGPAIEQSTYAREWLSQIPGWAARRGSSDCSSSSRWQRPTWSCGARPATVVGLP